MVTVILPGYSPHNKEWAEEVAKKLNLNHEIRPVFWDHWDDPDKSLKPKEKADDIIDILLGHEVNIIAKSVGTLVSAYVVAKIPQKVKKVILCGIPTVSDARFKPFQEAFTDFPGERVICFQNTKDPFATSTEVKEFMEKINPKIKVVEKSASNHNYPYYEHFQKFLR